MLVSLSLAAAAIPLIVEIDPWHGHVVVGGSNRVDQILALLDHRHTHPGELTASGIEAAGGPAILSIAERVMLSSLASLASEAALVPIFTLPLLMIFLALVVTWLLLPEFKLASMPPLALLPAYSPSSDSQWRSRAKHLHFAALGARAIQD